MEQAPQVSEVARLVVALAVLPIIARTAGALRMSGRSRPWFTITIGAIYASYFFSVAEGFFAEDILNAIQHMCFGVAGVFGALTAIETRKKVIEDL